VGGVDWERAERQGGGKKKRRGGGGEGEWLTVRVKCRGEGQGEAETAARFEKIDGQKFRWANGGRNQKCSWDVNSLRRLADPDGSNVRGGENNKGKKKKNQPEV